MNKQEAVEELARLTELTNSLLAQMMGIADEHDIQLELSSLGYQWYVPKNVGAAERPPVTWAWDGPDKEWEEAHPEWDGQWYGWQNSSSTC